MIYFVAVDTCCDRGQRVVLIRRLRRIVICHCLSCAPIQAIFIRFLRIFTSGAAGFSTVFVFFFGDTRVGAHAVIEANVFLLIYPRVSSVRLLSTTPDNDFVRLSSVCTIVGTSCPRRGSGSHDRKSLSCDSPQKRGF